MINKEFNKLIPYVSENFITYPLWEEGKYIPFINFWYVDKVKDKINNNIKKFKNENYTLVKQEDFYPFKTCIVHYQIYPTFEENEELGYVFNKENWSIEEMIKIIIKLLNL